MNKREEILGMIESIFQNELEDSNLVLSFDSSTENVDKWDSINNLIIISAIEERFNVSFPVDVIFSAENVSDLITYIEENSDLKL